MNKHLTQLEPQIVWKYFAEITKYPRPSGHEKAIRNYLIKLAKELNLSCVVTEIGNLILSKPATDTSKPRKKIAMQAHMDMVPSKTKDSTHNFLTDPITTHIDGEWVKANNTTLGADNGIGLAMGLAILASNNIKHNDIELLITTDEEAGMGGAFALDGSELNSEVLINIDTEDDDEVCIGCAGGINTNITYPIIKEKANLDSTFKIELKGLFSGHSGCDITRGRANAIKEIAYLAYELNQKIEFELVAINGGKLRNVIPNYAEITINISEKDATTLDTFIKQYKLNLQKEFSNTDFNLDLSCEKIETAKQKIQDTQTKTIIQALCSCFNGVMRLNNELGIAETSSNIGVVISHQNNIEIITLQRSAHESSKIKMANTIASLFHLIGAKVEHSDSYPGWVPNLQSIALTQIQQSYRELFNQEIKVGATHGGLECGLILAKYPHMDAISMGPTIRDAHSPTEKLFIPAVAKSWKLLVNLVERL